jgi:hypothetical protein
MLKIFLIARNVARDALRSFVEKKNFFCSRNTIVISVLRNIAMKS